MSEFESEFTSLSSFTLIDGFISVFPPCVCSHVKSKQGKKGADESDSDNSDMDDLDDEEVSLGSMDEEDFGDELEEEGGMFMDPDGGGDDDEGKIY